MAGVGQRIKELRKAANLTQQELAEGVVTRSYISQIEKGLIQPSYDTLEKLSKRLNCSIEDFFKEPENKAMLITEWKKYVRFAEGHAESGQYEQAKKMLDNLNNATLDDLNEYDLGILYWVRGKLFEQQNQFEEAMPHFEESLRHLKEYVDSKEKVRSLDSLAYCYLQLNQNQTALRILNDANEVIIRYHLGGLTKTSVLINTGVAHAKLGEHHSAISLLKEASYLNQSMNVHYKAGHIYITLGICHMRVGKTEEAVTHYRQAIDFYEYAGDAENRAGAFTNLGILYTNTAQPELAIQAQKTAISIYEELRAVHRHTAPTEAIRLHARAINARIELARAYFHANKFDHVLEICQDIVREESEVRFKAFAYLYLGEVDFKQARFHEALYNFQASHDLFRHVNDAVYVPQMQEKLADTYFELKQFEQAATLYKSKNEATRIPPAPAITP